MKKYDIAIVGGGPAGATFARLVGDDYKVLLIDPKDDSEKSFTKVCGGLLSSDAQKALSKFELTLPKDVLVDPQIFSVKTIDVQAKLIRHYQRFYVNLDRKKFDLWLLSLVPESVDRCFNLVKKINKQDGEFVIDCGDEKYHSKYIVGADGANSIVRRTFFKKRKMRYYVAIQQWFKETSLNPFYSCIFDSKTSDCCSWSISKDNYLIYGGAFAPNNCRAQFEKQKQSLAEFGFSFDEPLRTEACMVYRPSSIRDFCCGRDNVLLIGEAAGFISPSSLEGFSWAINSATLLADSFISGENNVAKKYKKKTFKIRVKLLGKILKCPFMYKPWLRHLVMKSGLKAIRMRDDEIES